MAKNTKGAKTTQKRRTKVKDLKISKKEMSATEKKKVKGGLLPAVRNISTNTIGGALSSDTFTASLGGDSINFKK